MTRHGTFWLGWTATQEARWRRNYQVWMATLLEFGRKGGVITVGDDAGYLYGSLYGFGTVRELVLHQEAAFVTLDVTRHATVHGAQVLGLADKLGRARRFRRRPARRERQPARESPSAESVRHGSDDDRRQGRRQLLRRHQARGSARRIRAR